MFNIHLVNQNVTIHAEDGELLSQACADAGFPLDLVCGGKGKCGKCRVDIARMGQKESVLACIFKVDSDMEVWLKEEQLSRTGSILTEGQSAHERRLDPALTRTCYTAGTPGSPPWARSRSPSPATGTRCCPWTAGI